MDTETKNVEKHIIDLMVSQKDIINAVLKNVQVNIVQRKEQRQD